MIDASESAHHHQRNLFLMITHDLKGLTQFADQYSFGSRPELSPWRCFNVHDIEGEGDHA